MDDYYKKKKETDKAVEIYKELKECSCEESPEAPTKLKLKPKRFQRARKALNGK